jgi:hypothetical protein
MIDVYAPGQAAAFGFLTFQAHRASSQQHVAQEGQVVQRLMSSGPSAELAHVL